MNRDNKECFIFLISIRAMNLKSLLNVLHSRDDEGGSVMIKSNIIA